MTISKTMIRGESEKERLGIGMSDDYFVRQMRLASKFFETLSIFGFLKISNGSGACTFSRPTRRWKIEFEIRLGDGISFSTLCDDSYFLEAVVKIYESSLIWMAENFPQYLPNANNGE